jgi:hypothetical protein
LKGRGWNGRKEGSVESPYMWSTGAAEGGLHRIERSMATERRSIRSGQGRDRERVDGKRMTRTIDGRRRMN